MRDRHDNVVVVCSIENIDPMGVHTGDSVTVAPAMTLTDREYQHMRDIAIAVVRAVGVDTGGCNIQFAVHPRTGRMVVIEMNPRVSRSSALASKATGFPIAKIAARLAIGYTLDEIRNDITGETPASFEPALDYVVVKVPRFAFEKFPGADPVLTTHMKSVGEAMAIGRSFPEALQKALRSLENPAAPLSLARAARRPRPSCWPAARSRTTAGWPPCTRRCGPARPWREVAEVTGIDPWFVDQIQAHPGTRRTARRGQLPRPPGTRPGAELDAGAAPRGQAGRLLRRPDRRAHRACRKTRSGCSGTPSASGPCTTRWTPAPRSSRPARRTCTPPTTRRPRCPPGERAQGDHPGQRAEPDRPGHRVRLRLRARLVRAGRGGLRDRDGQLQPGDRLHRLRHVRAAVLRAAHPGGRARGGARRAAERPGGRGDRAARRADPARPGPGAGRRRACRSWAPARTRSTWPRTAASSARCWPRPGCPRRGTAPRCRYAEAKAVADEIGYPVLVRPSYVLGGRGMEIVYDDATLEAYVRPGRGGQPGAPGAHRPVPRRRDRDRRGRAVRRRRSCSSAA